MMRSGPGAGCARPWTMRRRRTSVERFINSCQKSPQMTDEEIQAEINAYRQGL